MPFGDLTNRWKRLVPPGVRFSSPWGECLLYSIGSLRDNDLRFAAIAFLTSSNSHLASNSKFPHHFVAYHIVSVTLGQTHKKACYPFREDLPEASEKDSFSAVEAIFTPALMLLAWLLDSGRTRYSDNDIYASFFNRTGLHHVLRQKTIVFGANVSRSEQ